jgi:hypothetical protein
MGRGTSILIPILALLSMPGLARAAAACPPRGATTIARDRTVRVYRSGRERPAACLLGHSGHVTLPTGGSLHSSDSSFELAGPIVGYIQTQFGVDSGSSQLIVLDVAKRRLLRSIDGGSYVDAGLILSEGIASFVLDAHGAIAWISTRSEHRQPATLAVHAAARTGAPAKLDEGPGIDPHSLRLSHGILSWSDGGVRHSAAMP